MIRGFALGLGLLTLGCVSTPQDPIGRMHPYLYAADDQVQWFTCRWSTEAPIGYAILGTSEAETRQLRRVLDVWQGMGFGVRFVEVPAAGAQLILSAVEGSVDRDDGSLGAGRTVTDCKLDESGEVASARLVKARVDVARASGPGPLGKMHPLSPSAWLGAWTHELGHALGYQGHLRSGVDPMRLEPDYQRFVGERIASGSPVDSPALRALYARPNGTLLGSAALPEGRTADVDEIRRLARQANVEGPFLRSGDRAARIFWENNRGRQYGFLVLDFPGVLERVETLVLFPEAQSQRELR
jgi:hypothetical protein